MYLALNDKIQNQKLKVQEVVIRFADTTLYATTASNSVVLIGEPLSAIVSVDQHDDSASAIVCVQAASLSIVDSVAFTAGGDQSAILVSGNKMAANDNYLVRYITQD